MEAKRDQNFNPTLQGVSSVDAVTPINLQVNPATGRLLVDSNSSGGGGLVYGDKTNNGAAPGADSMNVLPAVATAAAPTYNQGRQVALSTDLSGALRVTGSLSVGGFTDDSAFTPAASTGNMIMGFFNNVAPDSVDEGDGGAVRMSQNRNLFVTLRDAAGNERGLNIDSSNRMGTVAVGADAHDAPITVAPQTIGGYASAAAPVDVSTDGDAVRAWFLRNGAQANQLTFGGVLASVNAGANGAGVQRVTLATDSTAISTVGYMSVKLDQTTPGTTNAMSLGYLANTAVAVNNGVVGAGVLRVTIASDSTGALASVGSITTNVVPGVAATSLGKAEDAVHASGDTGVFALAVRTDTLAASSGTNGDYEAFHTDASGALWTRDITSLVDDAPFTPATSRVMPIGHTADEVGTDLVDEGDIGVPRMTLDRKAITTPQAHTQGGATPYKLNSAATTNATSVKASAGQIYSIVAMNTNAAARYLKLYNKASAPTVGTDVPLQTYLLPGNATGAGFAMSIPVGMEFTTGIAFAITALGTDADTTAVAANEILVNLTYK